MRHPETELIALVRGELGGPAYDHVVRHLQNCAACRDLRDDFRSTLAVLRQGPAPPAVSWAQYRAELRVKREARAERAARRSWWQWPVPLALSAGLASVLLFLAVHGGLRSGHPVDDLASSEAAIGRRLELLRNYSVVESLDLLEDFDIIRNLDGAAGRREG